MKYLIVILDKAAQSFCYYKNNNKKSELISIENLKKIIFFAQKEGMAINFLVGNTELPKSYKEEIDKISHIFISPIVYKDKTLEDVIAIDYSSNLKKEIERLKDSDISNIILRVEKKDITKLSDIVKEFDNKYKRLNITLLDIDKYTKNDFDVYKKELEKISNIYIDNLKQNKQIEINIISDRLFLEQMNNCEAGINHITFAPNGKFYICPAFYYEDEKQSIGDLEKGIEIKNQQLYKLDHAPICRICDAYQCKRCIWLNRRTTLEVNTPSHEQCVVSHLERNQSRETLKETNFYKDKKIKKINYLDPFEKVKR